MSGCPWCGSMEYDIIERDPDNDEYSCECGECHCFFLLKESFQIITKGNCEYMANEEDDKDD